MSTSHSLLTMPEEELMLHENGIKHLRTLPHPRRPVSVVTIVGNARQVRRAPSISHQRNVPPLTAILTKSSPPLVFSMA